MTLNITTFKDLNAKKYQKGMVYTCIMRKIFISKKISIKRLFHCLHFWYRKTKLNIHTSAV